MLERILRTLGVGLVMGFLVANLAIYWNLPWLVLTGLPLGALYALLDQRLFKD